MSATNKEGTLSFKPMVYQAKRLTRRNRSQEVLIKDLIIMSLTSVLTLALI